jgi:uncharacterized protein YdhG (YjbR/CyaY superfamily)
MGLYGKKERIAATPEAYVEGLESPRREDISRLHERIREVAPELAASAAQGMLTYGRYTYKSRSGAAGEWFPLGVASNKQYISVYASPQNLEPYVERLPKANLGRGCIRFKRLDDVDLEVLDEVIRAAVANDGAHFNY